MLDVYEVNSDVVADFYIAICHRYDVCVVLLTARARPLDLSNLCSGISYRKPQMCLLVWSRQLGC